MTYQERREKARRIAEAYCRIAALPITEPFLVHQTNLAYDKLCWMEAILEVEESDELSKLDAFRTELVEAANKQKS